MRRSVWIFFASILLPSLGLAWLAVRSVRDQQVVLEHQQVIISQNITDALANSIQGQMDQTRAGFVAATQQLLGQAQSPQALAENFNQSLPQAWPTAQIGFAVNLDGQVYSPKPYDSPDARTFLDENDRFLRNRENAEVYSSNSFNGFTTQNSSNSPSPIVVAKAQLASTLKSNPQFLTQEEKESINAPADMANQSRATAKSMDLASLDQYKSAPAAPRQEESKAQNGPTTYDKLTSTVVDEIKMKNTADDKSAAANQPQSALATASMPDHSATAAPASAPTGAADSIDALIQEKATAAASAPTPSHALPGAVSQSGNATPTVMPTLEGKMTVTDTSTQSAARLAQNASAAAVPPPVTVTVTTTVSPVVAPPWTKAAIESGTTLPPLSYYPPRGSGTVMGQGGVLEGAGTTHLVANSQRNVIPQKMLANQSASVSNTVPEESDFRRIIGTDTSGELARFLDDKLRLFVWMRPTADAPIIFGAQLDETKVIDALKAALRIPELTQDSSTKTTYLVAILDDTGKPVLLTGTATQGGPVSFDWKHPFVSTEIGEALPHWEAALYLLRPDELSHAARTLQITLALIVLLLVAAIVAGGSLIAADVRRQVRLAQQKTDFVSNVSHELKTPLTSIRMFADLLAEKRVPDEERQSAYLRIIAAEAARLTRLINNVLDFARLEKGKPHGERHACDLVDAVRDVAETCAPHLEGEGVVFQLEIETDKLPILGDRDALAQIILNLISNAEKYGGKEILVRVRRQETPGPHANAALGCVDVLDRGPGIPSKDVKTIFEPFHRLDDSLASGVPGSGLGLTLARRMARAHGGDVTYSARSGGGSCFTLTVPLEAA